MPSQPQSQSSSQQSQANPQDNESTPSAIVASLPALNNPSQAHFPVISVPVRMQSDLTFSKVTYISESDDPTDRATEFTVVDREPHTRERASSLGLSTMPRRSDVVVEGISGVVKPGSSCCILDGSGDRAADILLQVIYVQISCKYYKYIIFYVYLCALYCTVNFSGTRRQSCCYWHCIWVHYRQGLSSDTSCRL